MSPPEDQVLEHALEELLLDAQPTDLPRRVLESVRQKASARGPGQPARRNQWRLLVVAAAAVLLLAAWLVSRQRGSGEDRTTFVATAEVALGVLRPGESSRRQLVSFRLGETLVNGPQREHDITLAEGHTITLGRCAMLTLAQDERGLILEPRLGTTTLEARGPSPLRVRTELGTLVLRAPASVQLELHMDGYDLDHPEEFQQLAQEIHMNATIPMVLTVATLLAGSASIETAAGARELRVGESVQDPVDSIPAKELKARLLEEVGTWELTVTNIAADGTPSESLQGVEICRAGPGGQWLLSEQSIKQGQREVATHTVIGYDTRHRSYTGTLVDSFGGEMGMLKGTPGTDLDTRTLEMFSARGTPGFEARSRMVWESASRRRTELEVLQDEEWVLIREIIHERKK